jgi:hypothetical protein
MSTPIEPSSPSVEQTVAGVRLYRVVGRAAVDGGRVTDEVAATSAMDARSRAQTAGIQVELVELVAAAVVPAAPMGRSSDARSIRIPLLVAAISNIIIGVLWFLTYAGIIVAVPLWVLCYFQFREHSRLGTTPFVGRADAVSKLAVWTIVGGLFNWVALVCGILLITNGRDLRRSQTGEQS